jgi:hypothetical protein
MLSKRCRFALEGSFVKPASGKIRRLRRALAVGVTLSTLLVNGILATEALASEQSPKKGHYKRTSQNALNPDAYQDILCIDFLKNLRSFEDEEPDACNLKLNPKYGFSHLPWKPYDGKTPKPEAIEKAYMGLFFTEEGKKTKRYADIMRFLPSLREMLKSEPQSIMVAKVDNLLENRVNTLVRTRCKNPPGLDDWFFNRIFILNAEGDDVDIDSCHASQGYCMDIYGTLVRDMYHNLLNVTSYPDGDVSIYAIRVTPMKYKEMYRRDGAPAIGFPTICNYEWTPLRKEGTN